MWTRWGDAPESGWWGRTVRARRHRGKRRAELSCTRCRGGTNPPFPAFSVMRETQKRTHACSKLARCIGSKVLREQIANSSWVGFKLDPLRCIRFYIPSFGFPGKRAGWWLWLRVQHRRLVPCSELWICLCFTSCIDAPADEELLSSWAVTGGLSVAQSSFKEVFANGTYSLANFRALLQAESCMELGIGTGSAQTLCRFKRYITFTSYYIIEISRNFKGSNSLRGL